MSASSRPTFLPCIASAIAKLTDAVDLPTPPFPELTMMKFFTCGAMFLPLEELSRGILGAATFTVTLVAPSRLRASVDSTVIC